MKKNTPLGKTMLAFLFLFWLPVAALAQDGSLDATFGSGGFVITPIGLSDESGKCVAIQPDGRIVVAGMSENGPFGDIAIVRYDPDGSLDTTFDGDGKVITPVSMASWITSVVIQNDGKIVVAGGSSNGAYNDFTLARYLANGSLDTSFDQDGIVITDVAVHDDIARSVAIQPDGKIVAAGDAYNANADSYFTLVRYNIDGSLDTTFDSDGIDTLSFGNDMNWGYAVAIQTDGKIVVAGLTGEILGFHTALMRVNTDGSLDSGFNTNGKVVTTIGVDYDGAYAVAIQNDGKIVITGFSYNGNDDDFAVARYNSDGRLDTTFDADGIVVTQFGAYADTPNSLVLQDDDKIIAAGYSIVGGATYYFAMARYNPNGSLDTTFDSDGKVTSLLGSFSNTGAGIALQSDGKIVMAGDDVNFNGAAWQADFAVARYNNAILTGINTIKQPNSEINIYPNPVSNTALITFSLFKSQHVSIGIFDVSGKELKTLANKVFKAGNSELSWNATDVSAGIYFLKMKTETYSALKIVSVIK